MTLWSTGQLYTYLANVQVLEEEWRNPIKPMLKLQAASFCTKNTQYLSGSPTIGLLESAGASGALITL